MSEPLPWDDDALEQAKKIPFFVRPLAKKKIERAARDAGESRVSLDFMRANKAKLMG